MIKLKIKKIQTNFSLEYPGNYKYIGLTKNGSKV